MIRVIAENGEGFRLSLFEDKEDFFAYDTPQKRQELDAFASGFWWAINGACLSDGQFGLRVVVTVRGRELFTLDRGTWGGPDQHFPISRKER